MGRMDSINRKLRELDLELAEHRIDRARYRYLRRELLSGFEAHAADSLPEHTTRPQSTGATASNDPPASSEPDTGRESSVIVGSALRPTRLLGIAGGVLLVVGAITAAWWALAPKTDQSPTGIATLPGGKPMPQELASTLMQSDWTADDLSRFEAGWKVIPDVSIRAANEDPRLWLLRQEIEQRLRDAREAVALQDSERNVERVRQLEQIQDLIRHEISG